MRDIVAEKPVFLCEAGEDAVAEGIQSAPEGANPQGPVLVLIEGPKTITPQTIGHGKPARLSCFDSPETFSSGCSPHAAVGSLTQRHGAVLPEWSPRNGGHYTIEMSSCQSKDAAQACRPDLPP